ncbi:unnamed protein product, partial [Arabidopsis halleri]
YDFKLLSRSNYLIRSQSVSDPAGDESDGCDRILGNNSCRRRQEKRVIESE